MKKPRISIIVAVGRNRELGKKNELIWRIHADLKRVKELTMGHPLIMGLNTYKSIGRPLPGRTNIVLAFEPQEIPGCVVYTSFEEALAYAQTIESEELFIFGGASVYTRALPLTDRLYLTKIEATDADADAFFPDYSAFGRIVSEEKNTEGLLTYSWVILER